MLPDYQDILDVAGTPLWWDEHGVPRYHPFEPGMLGVYDRYALLVRIECQPCRTRMSVGCGWPAYAFPAAPTGDGNGIIRHSLASLAEGFTFGDPPWHGCRGAGETMQSVAVYIEQAWRREKTAWVRDPEVERIDIHPEWDQTGVDRRDDGGPGVDG